MFFKLMCVLYVIWPCVVWIWEHIRVNPESVAESTWAIYVIEVRFSCFTFVLTSKNLEFGSKSDRSAKIEVVPRHMCEYEVCVWTLTRNAHTHAHTTHSPKLMLRKINWK
jgi:hypothetical protein